MIRLPSSITGATPEPSSGAGGKIRLPASMIGESSAATAKKPIVPLATNSAGFAQTYKGGEGYGPSTIEDTTGKPLLAYENPQAQQTQILANRTATKFDPTVPQRIDPKTLSNSDKRMASGTIRQSLGATTKQQLDHIMPLELGGANTDTFGNVNLQLEPTVKGYNTATDPIENAITKKVLNGEISLVEGWREMAKAKGITLQEQGGKLTSPQQNPPTFLQRLTGGAKAVAGDIKNYFLGPKTNQQQTPIPQQSPMIRLGQELTGIPAPAIPTSLPSISDVVNKAVPASSILPSPKMTPEQQAQQNQISQMSTPPEWVATGKLAASIPQGIAQAALKFGVSAYQAPKTIVSGGTVVPDAIPVPPMIQKILGENEISSYQKDAATDIQNGANPIVAVGVNSAKVLFDAWIVNDIAGAALKPVLKSIASQLPESVLYKISEERIPVSDIMDVLRGTGKPSQKAADFVKSLADEERRPLAQLARESEKAGAQDIKVRHTGEPTMTGELLGVEKKAPQAIIETPSRALPGTQEVSPGPAVGLSTKEVRSVGGAGEVNKIQEGGLIQEAKKYSSAEEFVKAQTKSNSWSEAQKNNPDLWNSGILRKSQAPYKANGEIPIEVHSAQAKWQNYGQDGEIPASKIYDKTDNYGYYLDKEGNTIRDINGNALQNNQKFGGEDAMVSNQQLKDNLLQSFETPKGKKYLNEVVKALPKNSDGSITAYRIGSIGEGAQSYTLSEGMAKTFSNQGTDIPLPGTPGLPKGGYKDFGALPANMVKIDPKGIKAWSPYDAEILVEPKYVLTKSQLTDIWNKANKEVEAPRVEESQNEPIVGDGEINTEPLTGAAKTLLPAKYDEARAFGIEGSQAAESKFVNDQKIINGQNQRLLPTKKPSFWTKLKRDLSPMKYQEAPVRDAWLERTKDILVGNEKANKAFQELESLQKGFSSMIQYQRGEMGQGWDYAQKVKSLFDRLYQEGQDRGLKINYREHYLPQVYANPSGDVIQAVAKYMADNGVDQKVIVDYLSGKVLPEEISKTLKLNPSFTKDKAFPDYGVAMDYGLTPKFEHPGQLAGYYVTEMEKTLANKKYLDTLQDIGALSGTRRDGDKVLDIPYFAQDLYGKPRLVNALQAYFRDEENLGIGERILRGGATTNKRIMELALSGGAPATNVNFFTIGAGVVKDMTAGEMKVFGRFFRSNFEKATIDYFKSNQKYIDMMAEERINIGSRTGNWDRIYRQLSTKTGFSRATEWFGDKFDWAFNKKTFQSFMPMQAVDIFKRTFDSATKTGLQEAEARKLAADTTKAWMGMTEDWGRGRTLQDLINFLFFAPRFREGLINLFVNTGRAIAPAKFGGTFGNKAFKTNRKFLIGAVLSFTLYNLLNKKLNGNYMWQNESGKEFDLKIPYGNGKYVYLAFLPSVLAFPRNMASGAIALSKGDVSTAEQKFGSLFSMLIKATTEVISNKDYFGRQIFKDTDTTPVKIGKIAAYLGLNYNHPYVQSVYEMTTQGGNKDMFQTLSRAFELPFKFNSQEAINRSTFYDATNALKTPHARDVERVQPIYAKAQQLVQDGKQDEAQAIVDGLSDADYQIYKGIRTAAKSKATAQAEAQMVNTVNELRDLVSSGKQDEAQTILDGMSDEEYRIYNLAKKKMGL